MKEENPKSDIYKEHNRENQSKHLYFRHLADAFIKSDLQKMGQNILVLLETCVDTIIMMW